MPGCQFREISRYYGLGWSRSRSFAARFLGLLARLAVLGLWGACWLQFGLPAGPWAAAGSCIFVFWAGGARSKAGSGSHVGAWLPRWLMVLGPIPGVFPGWWPYSRVIPGLVPGLWPYSRVVPGWWPHSRVIPGLVPCSALFLSHSWLGPVLGAG